MKKRFLLAAVMAMCMMVMVMPAAFAAEGGTTSQPTASGNAFFANGTPITISAEAPADAEEVYFPSVTTSTSGIINSYISWTNSEGKLVYYAAPDTLVFIFGGSNGHTNPVSVANTSITMTGGKITNLYGGNYGAQSKEEGKGSTVVGNVTISLSGDAVVDYMLYGGGRYNTSVQGTVTMTFDGVDLSSANTDSCYVNGGVHGDGNEGTRNIEEGTMTTDAVVNKVVITATDSKFYLLGGGGGGSTKVNDSDVTLTECEVEYLFLSGINGEIENSTITLNNSDVESYSATNRGFVGTGRVDITNDSTIRKLNTGAASGCFSSDSGAADGSGVTGSVVYNIDANSTVETAVLTPYVSRNASGYTANFQNVTINNQAAPLELSIDSFVAVYDDSGNATRTLTEFQVPTGSKLDLNNVQTTVSTGQTLTNAGTIDMDEASKMTVAAGAKLEDNTDGSGITGTVVKEYAAQIGEIGYDSLQEAVENAKADDVITLLQNVEITSTITIPADVTLTAEEGVVITASNSVTSFILNEGATLNGLTITMTADPTAAVNMVTMGDDTTVTGCIFSGTYGGTDEEANEVSRAVVPNSGADVTITNNRITNLRQPGYINGGCTGTISGNYVDGTRGWVVCGSSDMTITSNTFGTNVVDIAIIKTDGNTETNNYAEELTDLSEANPGAVVEDQIQGNIHVQDGCFVAGTEQELRDALSAAQPGDTVKLTADIECTNKITLPAGVILDGNGKSITYTGGESSGAFLTAESGADKVTVKNITIHANNITHGVQFYCNNGGSLENVIVNGGTGTSVIVNGATNVTIKDSQLNPVEDFYATIEYGMGEVVTTAPSFTLNNVTTSDSNGIVVWADNNTVQRVIDNSSGTVTTENVADVITGNITTINNDSITIAIGVESGNPPEVIETPSTKPVVSNPTYTITNPTVTGGTVTVSPRSASRGRLVTLTVTPDEGYELVSLTVTDSRGSTVTLTDAGNGRYTFTMPGSRVVVNASFQVEALPFTDVAEGAWYYDAVAYVYRNGLMAGVSSTQFAPDSTLNRATLATILWRLAGEPVVNYVLPFEDVAEGEWYSEAIRWAASTGIVNGTTPTTFRPFNSVTREQMAAMVHRYAEYMDYDTTATTDLNTFTDAASVNGYAAEPMGWCVAEGLISGIGTEIRPQSSATRAQIATMLMRFCENIAK